MAGFNWHIPTKVVFGQGTLASLGAEVACLGGTKVLILTDPGVLSAGILDQIKAALPAKVAVEVFSQVVPEPPINNVANCVNLVRSGGFDLLIGVGGGSSIDATKLAAALAANPGTPEQYIGLNLLPKKGLPTIMIPTTAGTGSEVTPIAIVSDTNNHLKVGVVSPYLYPDVALCDPAVTVSMPPSVTAATGMDALTHAVEAYISVNASPMSDVLAFEAVHVISRWLRRAYANGKDLVAREKMLYGSLLAGMAFSQAGVGAVHALAYPLGGQFSVPHGVANAVLLPYVLEFNLMACLEKMPALAGAMDQPAKGLSPRQAALGLISAVRDLSADVEIPLDLRELNIPETALEPMAEAASKVTRLLGNNPRTASKLQILGIYRNAFGLPPADPKWQTKKSKGVG